MTCTCNPTWGTLVALVDGERRPATKNDEHSAAESAGTAQCATCAAPYPGHWTLAATIPAQNASPGKPSTAVDLLQRIVAQRTNGEVRPQQERMVDLVEKHIQSRSHLLVQAGTGTGKSLGYLIPAIKSGKRVVISTATKQLSEQIVNEDMPILAKAIPAAGGPSFTYALIKGRANFACKRDIDALVRLDEAAEDVADALFDAPARENSRRPSADDLRKLNDLLKWADRTTTGDRSEAPAVPDKVWDQVSTDAAGCAGSTACPFGEECFAEAARSKAREVDVVVTNHAQVAQDLRSPAPLLGEYDVLVFDEVHELESYLSSAWGKDVAPSTMKHQVALLARKIPKGATYEPAREKAASLIADLEALDEMLDTIEKGLLPTLPSALQDLLVTIAGKLRALVDAFEHAAGEKTVSAAVAAERKGAGGKFVELTEAVVSVAGDLSDGKDVRWLEPRRGNFGATLKTAPLWIGPRLMTLLGPTKTLIATSATITVGGTFDAFTRTLALREKITDDEGKVRDPRPFDAVDVGTPFNYAQQAVLYIPDNSFPAPTGPDRVAHTAAVRDELVGLVTAAGGRTLALFTTRRAAEEAAAHLRTHVSTPVLCQGDAPPAQLIRDFKADEATTLCATMGFWHGVDSPGTTCIQVVLDKVPFAPMDDPLMIARRKAVEDAGRSGFDEVFVASAAVMLAQGVGRLIRTASDRGVVAILDTRLQTKAYGRTMINSMPPMWPTRDRAVVEKSLGRLASAADAENPTPPAAKAQGSGPGRTTTPSGTGGVVRKAPPSKASTKALSTRRSA